MKIEEKLCCQYTCHGNVLRMVDLDLLILKFDARDVLFASALAALPREEELPLTYSTEQSSS